jgi:hypothetical protein
VGKVEFETTGAFNATGRMELLTFFFSALLATAEFATAISMR